MIKVPIVRKKSANPVDENKLIEFHKKVLKDDSDVHPYFTYLTSDKYNRSIVLTYGRYDENMKIVVLFFYPDSSYNEETCSMELTDLNNYQQKLKEFKDLNNWNKPL